MKLFLCFFLSFSFAALEIPCHASSSDEQLKEKVKRSFQENVKTQSDPFIFVVFGATGDLAARKLLPAIYNLAHEGHLPNQVAIVGFARGKQSHEEFRLKSGDAIDQFSRRKPKDNQFWERFKNKIFYHSSGFDQDQGYEELREQLTKIDQELGTQGNRIFFLAVHPSHFPLVIEKLHAHQLLHEPSAESPSWSRVIIEKPFGSDLESAVDLQNHLTRYLDESQIYRMDHYLGKEGVQNLLAFRFENALFEPLWNNKHIDHVQIILSEEIGIGSRAGFWEETGALRDILQNHLMQLLALVAMEHPANLEAVSIQKEKLKALNAIRPFPVEKMDDHVVRGQYGSGLVKEAKVPPYREEKGVPISSVVETYVAAKLMIDNPRWEGVPFYIRGGKRLAKQTTEILVSFKGANALLIRIQPNAGIFLKTIAKVPGMNKELMPVVFGYKPDAVFDKTSSEAYEKLIFDCAKGDNSLYVNGEEQLAAWRLLTPVLKHWKENPPKNFPNYPAGSAGPEAANKLVETQGHQWQSIEN